jgi:hypothetical protein
MFGRLVAAMGLFEDEEVMVDDILHDQVDGHHFQSLASSPELLKYVRVTAVKGTQKSARQEEEEE